MRYINRLTICGIVGADVQKIEANSTSIANFSVATSRKIKKKDGEESEVTQWHRCVAFGKLAEVIAEKVKKGSKVHVEGELQYQTYEKNDIKQCSAKLVVSDICFYIDMYADTAVKSTKASSILDSYDDELPF